MGKRGGGGSRKGAPNLTGTPQTNFSLRQEANGKKHVKVNAKSNLKLDHLQNLALWATEEASIPSLGAFFGHRLAACSEAIGVPTDPSLFTCQRCETILQPGNNCTVRIEKNRAKRKHRRSKKPLVTAQNNVVYNCHFCLHRNLKRGTPKGHMKELIPPKVKQSRKFKSSLQNINNVNPNKIDEVALQDVASDAGIITSPATPSVKTGTTLLEEKRRKRNRSGLARKPAESESKYSAASDAEKSISVSSKRRRKSWTSLKEIAESNFNKLSSIPMFI